jgi:hypothetical protein
MGRGGRASVGGEGRDDRREEAQKKESLRCRVLMVAQPVQCRVDRGSDDLLFPLR